MHKIIFLHIPKTAGTTFKQIIRRNYNRTERFGLEGDESMGTGRKLQNLTEIEREKIKFLGGHINFGLHHFFKEKCSYVTFLRSPIEREISYYNYVLRIPGHVHHQEVVSKKMSLEEYIQSDLHTSLDNSQTKQLAGIHTGLQSEPVPYTGDALELAKYNLTNHFIFSGLTERFDEGIILLNKALGWKNPLFYKSTNKNFYKKEDLKIADRVKQIIIDKNQLDISLYAYVKNNFEAQVEQKKAYVHKQMLLLRMCNSLYTTYNRIREK